MVYGYSDLIVNNTGTFEGGLYRFVKINSQAEIRGGLECATLKISSGADISGDVTARECIFDANTAIGGKVIADQMKVSGAATFRGEAGVGELRLSGRLLVLASLISNTSLVSGELKVNGKLAGDSFELSGRVTSEECEMRRFFSSGQFDIQVLRAANVEISLVNRCRAGIIQSEKLVVRENPSLRLFPFAFLLSHQRLFADSIEGDEIYLECTQANKVLGNRVIVGKHCKVDTVEYRESFDVAGNGKVRTTRRL